MKFAAIITIGNELLSGAVINTNATVIAGFVRRFGYTVRRILTVADHEAEIISALDGLHPLEELVFITGGLGPTNDDITRPVLARYFGAQLVFRRDIYEHIAALFAQRGVSLPDNNRIQAYFPDKAELLRNPVGCAPGMKFTRDGRTYLVLPGVPRELESILTEAVAPLLQGQAQPLCEKVYHFFGLPESRLYERLQPWIEQHPQLSFSFRPRDIQIDLAVLLTDSAQVDLQSATDAYIQRTCQQELFARDEETLESVVGALLSKKQLRLAVAESCTGGLIANRLTDVPGSSRYFLLGVVAYHNSAKINLLGVSDATLKKFGAVSAQTAQEMAQGVQKLAGAEIGLSTTGIAGPAGGSPQKPVGLVYIGLAIENEIYTWEFTFRRERTLNKKLFAQAALNQLRRTIIERYGV